MFPERAIPAHETAGYFKSGFFIELKSSEKLDTPA